MVKTELLRRAMVVTPNIPEAEVLADTSIRSLDDMRSAATANPRPRGPRRSGQRRAPRRAGIGRRRVHQRPHVRAARTADSRPPHARYGLHVCRGDCCKPCAGSTMSSWPSTRRGDTSRARSGMRLASAGVMARSTTSGAVPFILLGDGSGVQGRAGTARSRRDRDSRRHRRDGAVATFVGLVRDHNGGRRVQVARIRSVHTAGGESVRADRRRGGGRWHGARVAIHHRTGRLEIGEASVAIVAASPHRAEAFAVCRYAIERVKQIAPIWKREHFDGGDVWIEGATADPSDEAARAIAMERACT